MMMDFDNSDDQDQDEGEGVGGDIDIDIDINSNSSSSSNNNKRSYHDAVGSINRNSINNDNEKHDTNDSDNEAKITAKITKLTMFSPTEEQQLERHHHHHHHDNELCSLQSFHDLLPSEMIRRISTYLAPKDAVALGATSTGLRTILSLTRLPPRKLLAGPRNCYSTTSTTIDMGEEEEEIKLKQARQALQIPLYNNANNVSIHTLKMSFLWRIDQHVPFQLGPQQQLDAKVWIVGSSSRRNGNSTAATATTTDNENENKNIVNDDDNQTSVLFPGSGKSSRIVYESPLLTNTVGFGVQRQQPQSLSDINFIPLDGEVYHLWYRVSKRNSNTTRTAPNLPVKLILSNIMIEYLIFDNNEETLFGTNYDTLLTNGIIKQWDHPVGASEMFFANLLLSTCRSLRTKIVLHNKERTTTTNSSSSSSSSSSNNQDDDDDDDDNNKPIIDDIMSSFFDQYNITKNTSSLQIIEDIVQAEVDEKKEYRRMLEKEKKQNGGQRQQRQPGDGMGGGGGEGIAIGGGIRIQIDRQNGGVRQQVHQVHLGPDGQPIVHAAGNDDDGNDGNDNNNNGQQPQPQVFVHQIHIGPDGQPIVHAAAGNNGDRNDGGDNINNNGQQPQPHVINNNVFVHQMGDGAGGGGQGMMAGGLQNLFAAAAAAAALGGGNIDNNNNNGGGDGEQQQQQQGGVAGVDGVAAAAGVDGAEQQQNEIVNDQRNDDDDDDDDDDEIQHGRPLIGQVETVNMDLNNDYDDDDDDDDENLDGNNGGIDNGERRPAQQQHRNVEDQNEGYYGMLRDFLGVDQLPPDGEERQNRVNGAAGANDAAQQQENRERVPAAAGQLPPNLQNQIPQQAQDAMNQLPGFIGNIMNMVAQQQQQQPPRQGNNQGPNDVLPQDRVQPEVHIDVQMPQMAMGMEMFQQMMGGGRMQGDGNGGGNIPMFGFGNPNNNFNNFNNDDDDIPEID